MSCWVGERAVRWRRVTRGVRTTVRVISLKAVSRSSAVERLVARVGLPA
jgi:hypothetical protein